MNSIYDTLGIKRERADEISDKCYEIIVERQNDQDFIGIYKDVRKIPCNECEKFFVGYVMGSLNQISLNAADGVEPYLHEHKKKIKKAEDAKHPEFG